VSSNRFAVDPSVFAISGEQKIIDLLENFLCLASLKISDFLPLIDKYRLFFGKGLLCFSLDAKYFKFFTQMTAANQLKQASSCYFFRLRS